LRDEPAGDVVSDDDFAVILPFAANVSIADVARSK
jgi:hypothetical protein